MAKIVKIAEITGMEGNAIVMQDICCFVQRGVDQQGRVLGEFQATGVRPIFAERFKMFGFDLPPGIFEKGEGK